MNAKPNLFKLLLFFVFAFELLASVHAAENCSNAYYIDQTLSNGARWDMCWEHRSREGIVYHDIHYTPANGTRRKILAQASIAQIFVPYDDNGARFHDVSDYGLGGNYMSNLRSAECSGQRLTHSGKNVICQQIVAKQDAYHTGNGHRSGEALSLFSVSHIGAYNYIPQYQFFDDGTIEPSMGATGSLQRRGTNPAYGWLLSDGRYGISHLHNYYWRLDFDLGSSATDDIVQEINFSNNTTRTHTITQFSNETSRSISPSQMRRWRILDQGSINASNEYGGYEINFQNAGHRDIGPSSEPWTFNDFYVTRSNTCELYISHNPTNGGCGDNVSEFVNGESIAGRDITAWVGVTFHHVPRAEDEPRMHAHWNSFQLIPYNMHDNTPSYTPVQTNQPPTLSSIADRNDQEGDEINFNLQATDPDGDILTYTVTGLPAGVSNAGSNHVINGTLANGSTGSYNVDVTVQDGNGGSDSVSFIWTVTTGTVISEIVAHYQGDYQTSSPASGWQYLWNAQGPIGQANNYSAMLSNGSYYDSDGVSGLPDASNLAYGSMKSRGGHPGRGTSQGQTDDRYVIAAFTTNRAGNYQIVQSQITDSGCTRNGGLVKIYSKDSLISEQAFGATTTSFDTDIGSLIAGDTLYDGVGPNRTDGCDGFLWDFKLELSNASGNVAPVISNPGNQNNSNGDNANLAISASDQNGDSLQFNATGLPPGLSINTISGFISGTFTTPGPYNVSVSVSDGQGGNASVNFSWNVASVNGGQTVASYRADYASTPASGWSYLWNNNGPIGQSSNYTNLQWNGYYYDSDGARGVPDSTDLAYGTLRSTGGHAGRGTNQGQADDRFVIAAYQVSQAGNYRIAQSLASQSGCAFGNGSEVRVYVNNTLIQSLTYGQGSQTTFNLALGSLNINDTIYVGLGPNGKDGCDTFTWDYSIEKTN